MEYVNSETPFIWYTYFVRNPNRMETMMRRRIGCVLLLLSLLCLPLSAWAAQINEFSATSYAVHPGAWVELGWRCLGSTDHTVGTNFDTGGAPSGGRDVYPLVTTVYTLTAVDSAGETVSQSLTVHVDGTPPVPALAIYEDWTSGLIRSDRWQGGEGFGGQEARREIGLDPFGNFKLKLRFRREGSTGSDVGNGSSDMFLNVTRPTTVTEIEADFRVKTLSMNTCAANNAGSITRARPARLLLARFNDGASSGAGDATGDFRAGVQEQRNGSTADPEGVLQVAGSISRCSNAACSATTTPVISVLPTTVSVGETHNLKLIWDSPNNQFLFDLDNSGTPTALPYNPASNVKPAAVPFVDIDVFHSTANCTAGAVTIDSTTVVGTVRTDASAVIP